MRKFAELGTVHRCEPCQEYPGEWLVYCPIAVSFQVGELGESSHPDFETALGHARKLIDKLENVKAEYNPREISICWKCSDNDPRVGKVWFTGFYQHGKFDWFGNYKS